MYEVLSDNGGGIHFFPLDDGHRNAAPRRRPRGQRQPRAQFGFHHPQLPVQYAQPEPVQYAPAPYAPMPHPAYAYPAAYAAPAGVDMRSGLKAIGALLPVVGQLVTAFRRGPERPALTGMPDKDVAVMVDYVADNFEHGRTGAQAASVLATAGAVAKILADL